MTAEDFLQNAIRWAEADENVRRLVLVGSRARPEPHHPLADVDVQVHAVRTTPYLEATEWLRAIGRHWVCVHDAYDEGLLFVPTRLVIFEGGAKVDFAFYPAGWVPSGAAAAFPRRVLVAKQGRIEGERSGAARPRRDPTLRQVVEEFFFEAWHVAVYLVRGRMDLSLARLAAAREFLTTMAARHHAVAGGRRFDANREGPSSSPADPCEVWDELEAATSRFRRVAGEVVAATATAYPDDVDRNISSFIARLRAGAP